MPSFERRTHTAAVSILIAVGATGLSTLGRIAAKAQEGQEPGPLRLAGRPDSPSFGQPMFEDDDSLLTTGIASGPDLIVSEVSLGSLLYGSGHGSVGDIWAFSFGTVACNIGNRVALWIPKSNDHPVVAQNMYRLKDGRFEQIGLAWVKHGFFAVNGNRCGSCQTPNDYYLLGPGCSDPYDVDTNGDREYLGPRSEVNAYTGFFYYRWRPSPDATVIDGRLQVHESDLDPARNAGALYFAEAHYVAADDATAGLGNNNASYRRIIVNRRASDGWYVISASELYPTRLEAAINAWHTDDPDVVETSIRVPREGLFHLAAKATPLGTGFWRYEYAVHNHNSDRSAGSFSVPLPGGAVVTNIGFHDVDYHSREHYDGTDWAGVVESGAVTWRTETFEDNFNANALRWSTVYNFRFDANAAPSTVSSTLGLFKPGSPTEVRANTVGPSLAYVDCNHNGRSDLCDVDCGEPGGFCDRFGCGISLDCDANLVPDECEEDCNLNGVPDGCDLSRGTSTDCNQNTIPDNCDPDCDDDGIPDDCEDADQDGVMDCDDRCPETSGVDGCRCPPTGRCCLCHHLSLARCLDRPECVVGDVSTDICLQSLGVPECGGLCRDGCLLGDGDQDGDKDLGDFARLQNCFSGPSGRGTFAEPDADCRFAYDRDSDADVDGTDFEFFQGTMNGPHLP